MYLCLFIVTLTKKLLVNKYMTATFPNVEQFSYLQKCFNTLANGHFGPPGIQIHQSKYAGE